VERIVVDLLDQFERGKISRRQLVQSLTVGIVAASAGAPALAATTERSPFKVTGVNHISFGVADYARTRDFYAGLLGMQVSCDDGKQCNLACGQNSYIIARKSRQPDSKPFVDHIAYTIDNWDKKHVEEVLRSRGLDPRPDTDDSFHVKDPDGYNLQIAGKNLMSTC
jgi:catechol 2,3-dioxygenase-like lactoylglutathione lyase family enzyme